MYTAVFVALHFGHLYASMYPLFFISLSSSCTGVDSVSLSKKSVTKFTSSDLDIECPHVHVVVTLVWILSCAYIDCRSASFNSNSKNSSAPYCSSFHRAGTNVISFLNNFWTCWCFSTWFCSEIIVFARKYTHPVNSLHRNGRSACSLRSNFINSVD